MSLINWFDPEEVDGEVVEAETVDFDTVCKRAQSEIAARQNENYADPEAARLQSWLGDFVAAVFRSGK